MLKNQDCLLFVFFQLASHRFGHDRHAKDETSLEGIPKVLLPLLLDLTQLCSNL